MNNTKDSEFQSGITKIFTSLNNVEDNNEENCGILSSDNQENTDSLLVVEMTGSNNNIMREAIDTDRNNDDILAAENIINATVAQSDNSVTKRRRSNPNTWKRNIDKFKKNSGQSYVNRFSKSIPGKRLLPSCSEKCIFKCGTKFNENDRMSLFESFWKIANIELQRQYLFNCTTNIRPSYRSSWKKKPRELNRAYFFNKNEDRVRVCKVFFKNTLNISNSVIETAIKKHKNGKMECDLRGKHSNHLTVDPAFAESVRKHINSLTQIENRKQTSCLFIDGRLNVSKMYKLYQESCEVQNIEPAKKYFYERIFNEEYNVRQKKDQRGEFEVYNNSSSEQKHELQAVEDDTAISEKNFSRVKTEFDNDLISCDNLFDEGSTATNLFDEEPTTTNLSDKELTTTELSKDSRERNIQFGEYVALELNSLKYDYYKGRLKSEIRKIIAKIVDEDEETYWRKNPNLLPF